MALACVGDGIVDVYPSLRLAFPGGSALNTAVAVRRSGVESSYLGTVGSDPSGQILLKALLEENVETSHVRVLDGPTAYCTVDTVDGERVFGAADAGVSRVLLDKEDLDYLAGFEIVHSGDNSRCEDKLADMADVATLSYDFGERPAEYWMHLAPHVRVACFSGLRLAAGEAEDLARAVAGFGPKLVLVSQGARGAMVLDGTVIHRVGSAVSPVDTLGAGDSLIGCFLGEILSGETPREALAAATEVAVATCLHHGAFGHGRDFAEGAPLEGLPDPRWPRVFDASAHPKRD